VHEASRAVRVVSGPASGLLSACQRTFQQQNAQPFRHGTGQLDRLEGVGQRKLGRQPTPSYQLRHDGPTVEEASRRQPVPTYPHISQSMYSSYSCHQGLSMTAVTGASSAARSAEPFFASSERRNFWRQTGTGLIFAPGLSSITLQGLLALQKRRYSTGKWWRPMRSLVGKTSVFGDADSPGSTGRH
jgi:hypothetical protein